MASVSLHKVHSCDSPEVFEFNQFYNFHFVPTVALARQVFGMGRFEEGSNYAVNGFDAHMYRLVQILLLLPLAILQPQGKYQDDLQNNLKALCRQLEIQNGQGALLLAKVFHLFGRELLLSGLRFSSNPAMNASRIYSWQKSVKSRKRRLLWWKKVPWDERSS